MSALVDNGEPVLIYIYNLLTMLSIYSFVGNDSELGCEDGENEVIRTNVRLSKQLEGIKILDGSNYNINLDMQNNNGK